jgi:predicted nucleic acid-binding protein
VCCLNRPFDDQAQPRIRLESEAVLLILKAVEIGVFDLVTSDAVYVELSRHPRPDERGCIQQVLQSARERVEFSATTDDRARELNALGFAPLDALHVSFAETAAADALCTTDDGLLRLAQRHRHRLRVRVVNPVTWLEET